MADQNGSGRPPRNATENSNAAKCSSKTETPSRQISFHSLEPYDERNLHDADHSPRRSLVDASCAAVPAAAEAAPPLGQSDLSIPSMNSATGNGNRHATHGQHSAHIAPFPAPNTGHRRRKIGGVTSSKEHRSPRPSRSYAYHHQRGNQYDQQYNQSSQQSSFSHGHAPNHATTRRRTIRSTNRRTVAATAPVASAALPETTTPSLRPVLAALWRALLLAIVSKSKSIIQYCTSVTGKALARKWVRFALYFIGGVVAVFAACIATAAYGFYQEAKELCTPPSEDFVTQHPQLVEYFVHGRGNGHYARSVAIIEKLNDAGVDVRMFIGRATMWRAVHEAHLSSSTTDGRQRYEEKVGGYDKAKSGKSGKLRRGVTTAISVTSITPAMDVFATISHILERVTGDCEVARQTGRYPALVVTDGDIPGMLRSFFGSIPSVGISHGQTFSVGVKPSFIKSNKRLNAAWEKQSSLNWRAAFLTNWQIGTSFASMETRRPTGVIARSPMRPEAVGMARERWRRRHIGSRKNVFSSSGDGRNASSSTAETTASLATGTAHRFLTSEQRSKIDNLLLGGAKGRTAAAKHQSRRRRKLVICYFRDKNGDVLQNALLRSGFDVLLFERGYHKGLMNIQGVEKFGHKWIVHRDAKTDEEMADMELEEYWRKMLAGTDAKLLEDDEDSRMLQADDHRYLQVSRGRMKTLPTPYLRTNLASFE